MLKLKMFDVNLVTEGKGELERQFNKWSADNPGLRIVKQTFSLQDGAYQGDRATLLIIYEDRSAGVAQETTIGLQPEAA